MRTVRRRSPCIAAPSPSSPSSSSRCSPERAASTRTTRARTGQIAEGIKVNGVDVGGLSASQARTKLRAALLDPLNRPVTARYEGKRYKLTPAQAQIGVDIDGSVQRALVALARGRHPQPHLARGPRPADPHRPRREGLLLAARRSAASSRAIERDLAIEPVDATVDLEHGSVAPKASKDGRAVRAAAPAPRPRARAAGLRRAPRRARAHRASSSPRSPRRTSRRSIRPCWSSTAARSS